MPTINISSDYVVFDNTQPINLLNPDGSGGTVQYALQQGVDTVLSDSGDGTLAYRTFCTWNLWRDQLREANVILANSTPDKIVYQDPNNLAGPAWGIIWSQLTPQLNGRVTDASGTAWYISSVNLDAWGNKYQLECEAQAGSPVEEVDLPVL